MKRTVEELQEINENLACELALMRSWELRGSREFRDQAIAARRRAIAAAEREIRKIEKDFRLAPKRIAQCARRIRQLRAEATEIRCGKKITELVRLAREISGIET